MPAVCPNWDALIERADLRGPLGLLAQNSVLRERDGQTLVLGAARQRTCIWRCEPMVSQMADRISHALGQRDTAAFCQRQSGRIAGRRPHARRSARDVAQTAAEESIEGDPLVQALKREFGAPCGAAIHQTLSNPDISEFHVMKGQIGQLMQQAQRMQEDMKRAQEEIAKLEVTGSSGGGLVSVVMTGAHEVRRVQIDRQTVRR